jgi:hypothetical protein
LRCSLVVSSLTRSIRGLWRCRGIRPRPAGVSGLLLLDLRRAFLVRDFAAIFFLANYCANLPRRLGRRSFRDSFFRKCSTKEDFAKWREEKSIPVFPLHNCVLSKRVSSRGEKVGNPGNLRRGPLFPQLTGQTCSCPFQDSAGPSGSCSDVSMPG